MVSIYERGLPRNNAFIDVLKGSERVHLPKNDVLSLLGVQSIVRIPNHNYPDNFQPGAIVVTANLPIHEAETNIHVVLPRIMEMGYYDQSKGDERLPLLSFENVWYAHASNHIPLSSYAAALPEHCRNAIGFSNPDELKEVLLRRYHSSRPDLSDDDILSQGVSIRYLELLHRISFSGVIQ